MNEYKLSVIVPIYNEEHWLVDCLESILNQSYPDFELILVDDGSTDKSGLLCDEYVLKDSRIKVLHIKNSGIFQARKAGAKIAQGDILTFSDADDWLEYNAFEIAMELIDKYNPDIFSYAYIGECDKIERHLYEEGFYCKEEIKNKIIAGMMHDPMIGKRRLNPSLCCKFIKKELFMQITEKVKDRVTLGEDALVVYPAVCSSESIYLSNNGLYHYRTNDVSCTHTFTLEKILELKVFQNNIMRLFQEMDMLECLKYQIENYIRTFLSVMVRNWYEIELSPIMYHFPYDLFIKGSQILLYGAGSVGKSYINALRARKYATVVGWVDKNYEKVKVYNNIQILSPERIKEMKFDKLLIAILDERMANTIKNDLIKMGVDKSKIVWTKPVCIF